jgi:hypothetical protein
MKLEVKQIIRGWDWCIAPCGELMEATCFVCGTAMDVRRGVYGGIGFLGALSRSFKQDSFLCPHRLHKWHEQAFDLKRSLEQCPSNRIRTILREELAEVLTTQTPTI